MGVRRPFPFSLFLFDVGSGCPLFAYVLVLFLVLFFNVESNFIEKREIVTVIYNFLRVAFGFEVLGKQV